MKTLTNLTPSYYQECSVCRRIEVVGLVLMVIKATDDVQELLIASVDEVESMVAD